MTDELDRIRDERDFFQELLTLGSQHEIRPLLEHALDLIVRVTDAKKGYIEISPDDPDKREMWSIAKSCTDGDVVEIRTHISHGIIQEAMAQGRTIETASAVSDRRFRDNPSVRSNQIRAVLCAPVGKPPLGVVYLQGRNKPGPFSVEDKKQAELFAMQLAPLTDRLVSQERRHQETDPTAEIRAIFQCSGHCWAGRATGPGLAYGVMSGAAGHRRVDHRAVGYGQDRAGSCHRAKTACAPRAHLSSSTARPSPTPCSRANSLAPCPAPIPGPPGA